MLAASLVVGTATTVGYSLATGFDRSAEQSDLPDVIARFTRAPRARSTRASRALPNLQARSYRHEQLNRQLAFGRTGPRKGAITALLGGRRGYTIVDGHDLRDGDVGEVVVERGLAREWDISVGDALATRRTRARCGSPGSRSRPTTSPTRWPSAARVYVTEREFIDAFGLGAACGRTPRCCGSTTRRRPTSR